MNKNYEFNVSLVKLGSNTSNYNWYNYSLATA